MSRSRTPGSWAMQQHPGVVGQEAPVRQRLTILNRGSDGGSSQPRPVAHRVRKRGVVPIPRQPRQPGASAEDRTRPGHFMIVARNGQIAPGTGHDHEITPSGDAAPSASLPAADMPLCPEEGCVPGPVPVLGPAADRRDVNVSRIGPGRCHIAPVAGRREQGPSGTPEPGVTPGTPDAGHGAATGECQTDMTVRRPDGTRGRTPSTRRRDTRGGRDSREDHAGTVTLVIEGPSTLL